VTLTDAAGLARLEAALAEVDALWPEGLRIRLIGPTPAISFCALSVDRPGRGALTAARRRLGLDDGPLDRAAVRAAFRRAAMAGRSDRAPGADGVAAELRAAAALLGWAAEAQAGLALAGLDGPAPRITALREGAVGGLREDAA
jgi:hypothetical protein